MARAVALEPDRTKSQIVGMSDANAPRTQIKRTLRKLRYRRICPGVGSKLPTKHSVKAVREYHAYLLGPKT
jgi:hypothetical protein